MATDTTLEHNKEAEDLWDGGVSPMKVSYGKLMMWFLIVSDTFSFAALLITYAAQRTMQPFWPAPTSVFNSFPGLDGVNLPLGFVTLMTFLLILSSVFVVRAVQEGHRMNQKGVLIWLFFGILGGIAFLSCQALEWEHLIHQGMTAWGGNPFGYWINEAGELIGTTLLLDPTTCEFVPDADVAAGAVFSQGPSAFGGLFYGITGFHGFHVTTGVIINIIVWIQVLRGVYQRRGHYEMVEKVGLYWHFVDLVWVFVFLAFYLL